MSRALNYVPRVAIFLAGVAAAALTLPRRERGAATGMDPAALDEVKKTLTGLERRMELREAADAARFVQVETTLQEHTAKLADVPSTSQIVAAMEQLLSKTMGSLDERLSNQARSIEVLKTTVSQTDSLLERVLESLDTLQSYSDPTEFAEDPLLSRPAV
jgi:chromosome segregation ATPase